MANRLVWNNVQAPNFAPASYLLGNAIETLNNSFNPLTKAVNAYQKDLESKAGAQLLKDASAYMSDPTQYQSFLEQARTNEAYKRANVADWVKAQQGLENAIANKSNLYKQSQLEKSDAQDAEDQAKLVPFLAEHGPQILANPETFLSAMAKLKYQGLSIKAMEKALNLYNSGLKNDNTRASTQGIRLSNREKAEKLDMSNLENQLDFQVYKGGFKSREDFLSSQAGHQWTSSLSPKHQSILSKAYAPSLAKETEFKTLLPSSNVKEQELINTESTSQARVDDLLAEQGKLEQENKDLRNRVSQSKKASSDELESFKKANPLVYKSYMDNPKMFDILINKYKDKSDEEVREALKSKDSIPAQILNRISYATSSGAPQEQSERWEKAGGFDPALVDQLLQMRKYVNPSKSSEGNDLYQQISQNQMNRAKNQQELSNAQKALKEATEASNRYKATTEKIETGFGTLDSEPTSLGYNQYKGRTASLTPTERQKRFKSMRSGVKSAIDSKVMQAEGDLANTYKKLGISEQSLKSVTDPNAFSAENKAKALKQVYDIVGVGSKKVSDSATERLGGAINTIFNRNPDVPPSIIAEVISNSMRESRLPWSKDTDIDSSNVNDYIKGLEDVVGSNLVNIMEKIKLTKGNSISVLKTLQTQEDALAKKIETLQEALGMAKAGSLAQEQLQRELYKTQTEYNALTRKIY